MKYFISLFTIIILGCNGREPIITGLEGEPLPQFTVLLPDSSTYFNSTYIPKDKPFVVLYFSPFCPYCKSQIKDVLDNLESLRGLHFYLITNFPFSDMKKFYTYNKLAKFSNITVGRDITNYVERYFSIANVPYLAVYGREKRLINAFEGKMDVTQIKKIVSKK